MQVLRGSVLGYRWTHPDHPGVWTMKKLGPYEVVFASLPKEAEEIKVPRADWRGWKCIGL